MILTMNAAKALQDKQNSYDLLHHKMRAASLNGRPDRNWIERDMLRQSLQILSDLDLPKRSVDLSDTKYLAELDTFEASESDVSKKCA